MKDHWVTRFGRGLDNKSLLSNRDRVRTIGNPSIETLLESVLEQGGDQQELRPFHSKFTRV